MIAVLRSGQWSWARVPKLEAWTLDRNWHRTEAERCLKARNFADAERHLVAAVEDADDRGAFTSKRVVLRIKLAEVQRRRANPGVPGQLAIPDKLNAAEETVREALGIAAKGSDQVSYMNCLDALAEVFVDMGNFPALEKLEEEAVRLGSLLPRIDPLRMARRVRLLGFARHRNGSPAHAISTFEKALTLHERNFGPKHLETGNLLTEVGQVYMAQGDHAKAKDCFERALKIHQTECGNDSIETLNDTQLLAGAQDAAGNREEAAAAYERILIIKSRRLGGDPEDIAELQFSLANLYVDWGNLARARELLTECTRTFKRQGGPRLAVGCETLAQVDELAGRYFDALKELGDAAKAWEKCGAARTQELIRNLEYQVELMDQLRQKREAIRLRQRIEELSASVAEEVAPG